MKLFDKKIVNIVTGMQVIGVTKMVKKHSMGVFTKFLTFVRKNMNCTLLLVRLSLSLILPSAMRLSVGWEGAISFLKLEVVNCK